MPRLDLSDKSAITKAKVQIVHQEPLIMGLPEEIDLQLDWNNYNCEYDPGGDIHFDCDGGKVIAELAQRIDHPEFSELAQVCSESRSRVDIDVRHHRLVFHE